MSTTDSNSVPKRWCDMTPEERAGIDMATKIGLTIEFKTSHAPWLAANKLRFGDHYYRIKPNDDIAKA